MEKKNFYVVYDQYLRGWTVKFPNHSSPTDKNGDILSWEEENDAKSAGRKIAKRNTPSNLILMNRAYTKCRLVNDYY